MPTHGIADVRLVDQMLSGFEFDGAHSQRCPNDCRQAGGVRVKELSQKNRDCANSLRIGL
jgi:hypothetical protein